MKDDRDSKNGVVQVFLRLSIILSCLFYCSCGYHWSSNQEPKTISIPYVIGDHDGSLTAAIIHRICSATDAKIASQGRYQLDVSIVEESAETIGYRRDPQKVRGKIRKNLIQNEERKTIAVEFSLFDNEESRLIFGPEKISVFEDFDYIDGDSLMDLQFQNAVGQKFVVLPFSLGQLEPQEAAQEAAHFSLYQKISQKIVDVVKSQW